MMINPSSHPPIASPSQTKSILKKLGLSTKKRWGQNFLIDSQIVDHILDRADIGSDDYVLEI
ncbi:MAG: 16S rRNA (adenine(1518)-N(6)/adenine(1519)-N(6))-dimethyltransferase, partial [Clostridiales bacterium]